MDDANAFRFMARLKAAIEDYESGRMTHTQLIIYLNRLTTHF